jgi:two-component system copper resistance phosphate regulon response regulator CusR
MVDVRRPLTIVTTVRDGGDDGPGDDGPGAAAASDRTAEPTVQTHGGLQPDLRTRRARMSGRTVDLSAREFTMAETFLRHPGQVLSREQLLSRVWGYDVDPGSNVVDVHVRYLRRNIGAERIVTVRGMGYRLDG